MVLEELSLDIHLTQVKNCEILLNMLEENTPDLLFLDLIMPRKDGLTTLKEIRANNRYDNLAIIILTSVESRMHKRLCYDHGAHRFIYKDTDFTRFKNKISTVFNNGHSVSSLRVPFEDFVVN